MYLQFCSFALFTLSQSFINSLKRSWPFGWSKAYHLNPLHYNNVMLIAQEEEEDVMPWVHTSTPEGEI